MLSGKKIEVDGNTFELNVDSKDAVIVRLIRFYQKNISHKLGNRCVFDPNCSHYSELAFRKKGFTNGIRLTVKRLYRCRPKNGGIDEYAEADYKFQLFYK